MSIPSWSVCLPFADIPSKKVKHYPDGKEKILSEMEARGTFTFSLLNGYRGKRVCVLKPK